MAIKPKRFRTRPKQKSFHQSKTDVWYNLKIWRGNPNKPLGQRGGLREEHLLSNPCCENCKEEGIINYVLEKGKGVVDHIKRFRSAPTESEQYQLFTDPKNLSTLCQRCHNRKTGSER